MRLVSYSDISIPLESSVSITRSTNFTDPTPLLTENFLSVCCANDDVGDGRRDPDFDPRVAFFSQLAFEELVELGVEDTICYELSALGDVNTARCGCCGCHAGLLNVAVTFQSIR